MLAMFKLFEQDANNDIRNPAHSFKGWGSEKTDYVSEPNATSDFIGKADDSADTQKKKLATPGKSQVANDAKVRVTYDIPPFRSGAMTKVTPTSRL